MTNKFKIDGMTCESCVQKITEKLKEIPHIQSVSVSLKDKTASIESHNGISMLEAQEALRELPKYSVVEFTNSNTFVDSEPTVLVEESKFKTYKPLIIIFTYIFLVSLSYQYYQGSFHFHVFMNHIMAGFFLGLSYFKFLDLKAFAEAFSSYDPLAQRVLIYGRIYPFIELLLGLMFISGIGLLAANIATMIVLFVTTVGVIKRLRSKSKFQCACLGAGFNLPLSYVTVFENAVMILMALYNILVVS